MKKNDLKMIYSGIMYTFSLNISSIHLMYLRCRHIGSDRNEVFEEAIRVKSDPNIPTIMKQWPCRRKPRPSLMMMDGVHLVGRSQLAAEACKMDAKLQTALANLSSIANQFGLLGASTQSNAFEFNKQKKKTLGGQRNKSRPLHLVDGTRFLLFVFFFHLCRLQRSPLRRLHTCRGQFGRFSLWCWLFSRPKDDDPAPFPPLPLPLTPPMIHPLYFV